MFVRTDDTYITRSHAANSPYSEDHSGNTLLVFAVVVNSITLVPHMHYTKANFQL